MCLEMGGKNALVVCGDADLDNASAGQLQSSFSNAGQRCAAASRIVVFDAVYEEFRRRFSGRRGFTDTGPVISEASLERIVETSRGSMAGETVLCGGDRLDRDGWWLRPTVVEGVAPTPRTRAPSSSARDHPLSRGDLAEALRVVNDSPYGLTSAVHTASLHRAMGSRRRPRRGWSSSTAGRTARSRTWASAA